MQAVFYIYNMRHHPFEVYILSLLLLFLAAGAIFGGGALIWKPDGSLLHMDPWLNKIPFGNFLIPGIILFVFEGLLPLLVVSGLLFQPNGGILNRLNLYREQHWAWTFSLYSGIITMAWIIIQQFLTDYFVLQPMIALTGLCIVILTLMPRVMRRYKEFR